jgi:hypothetical protein
VTPETEPPGPPPPPPPPRPVYYESRVGILAGARLGYDVMAGGLLPQSNNQNASGSQPGSVSLAQAFGNMFSLGVQAGVRFNRRLYLGVYYDHGFGGGGSNTSDLAEWYSSTGLSSSSGSSSTSVTAHGNRVALDGAYISNPDGIGIILDIAVAYRELGLAASNKAFSADYTGGEVIFGGGLWIKAGQSVRIVPRVDLALGSFGNQSVTCNSSAGCDINSGSGGISNAPLHVTLFAGIGGYFNLDFVSRR